MIMLVYVLSTENVDKYSKIKFYSAIVLVTSAVTAKS